METYQEVCVSRASGITFLKQQMCNIAKFGKYHLGSENDINIDCYL